MHPAFVHVIQQLTPDEAVLLQHFAKLERSFSIHEEGTDQGYTPGTDSVSQQFRSVCEQAGVSDSSQSDGYLDNLLRLRILAELQWNESEYHPPGGNRYGTYEGFVENKTGRLIELAAFGEKFLATCAGH